jgi:hypothetical protein
MSLNRYFFALQEKLKASDSMSDWISDFKKSDAPQFAGKSKEKRRQMAIAAKLGAERGPKNEETYSDTGWKKPQTSAKTKNVAQNLARKAMNQSEKETKKEKGFGPSPADKLSIRKEDVDLDEAKYPGFRPGLGLGKRGAPSQKNNYGDFNDGRPLGFTPINDKDEPKSGMSDKLRQAKIKNPAMKSMTKEEVEELDELDQTTLTKYATRAKFSSDPKRREGAAKAQEKINKKSKDMQKEEAEQVDEVLDSAGKFMSYTTKAAVSGLKSAVTGTGKFRKRQAGIQTAVRKTKEKIANKEVDESIGSTVGSLIGQYAGSKIGMEGPGRVGGGVAGRAIEYHVRKFANKLRKKITGKNESVELEESHFKVGDKVKCKASGMKGEVVKLDKEEGEDTEKYYTVKREDGTTKKMAPKDMTKINEETDQIDEVSAGLAKSVAQRRDQDFRKMTPTETQKRRMGRGDWRADPSLQADKAYKSAVKRGAKDVYGYNEEKMSDTEEKTEMAATQAHFIKYAAEEIIEYLEMDGEIEEWYQNKLSKVHSDMEGLHSWMEGHKRKEGMVEETEELDEISQNTALNAYAKRAERAASTKNPKDQEKADKSITRIGKRWTADAQRRAWNRADKLIYKEETDLEEGKKKGLWDNIHAKRKRGERPARPGEKGYPKTLNIESADLDEAGKLQGGAKDPCWTGYKMIGTKKKNGREVPNCVPREEKEYKTFKALKEELNGDSNRS